LGGRWNEAPWYWGFGEAKREVKMISTLSATLTDTLNLLVKAFRLSSLFPAFCFALVQGALLVLHPYDQSFFLMLKNADLSVPNTLIFFVFLLAALLSYLLNYLNPRLMFLAEGYPFLNTLWGRAMTAWYKEHKRWIEIQVDRDDLPEIAKLLYRDKLGDDFPRETERCGPTALANVTAAFETYSNQRYGIDAVYLWPRLVPILTKEKFAVFVEREKEGMDFFLNLSALSALLAVESIVLRLLLANPIFSWIALLSGCVAYLFYRGTVYCAHSWGESIKTAFDLYRYELAGQLALAPFEDRKEEVERWTKLSRFIKYGHWRDFREYAYPLPSVTQGSDEPNENEPETRG